MFIIIYLLIRKNIRNYELDYWGVSNLEILKKISEIKNYKNKNIFIFSESPYQYSLKMIEKRDYNLILNHVNKLNLSISVNKFFTKKNLNKILYFMAKDKKNKSQKINLVLLKKIGSPQINNEYSKERLKKFFTDYLR